MFTLIRLTVAVAILIYVSCNFRDVKARIVNHESDPFHATPVTSSLASAFGGVKDYVAARQGARSADTISYVRGGSDTYIGGYLSSRPAATGTAGKSMAETACDFYPDQCDN